ncbi:MAG: NADPH-dependent FMN reductase [Rhodothermales bacterium]
MIKLVAIQGSVRPDNNTAKALNIVAHAVKQTEGVAFEVIDPTDMQFALPGKGQTEDAKKMQQILAGADGVILATPEYHGSYSSVIKLLIDNMGFPSGLSGKPVALLGVAAGRIGAIKALEHLRSVASHVGAIVLPGPVSIANVRGVFDQDGKVLDEGVQHLVEKLVQGLIDYIKTTTCPLEGFESFTRKTDGEQINQ